MLLVASINLYAQDRVSDPALPAAASADASPSAQQEADSSKEDRQADEARQDDDKPKTNPGQLDLDKAFELKISAASTRDLDKIADLCESAVDKGLDAESEEQARELWASALYDHAKQLDRRIAPQGQLSTRWRWLRAQAISRLEKAIELRPDKVDALILLSRLHSLPAGDREAAVAAIEKAIAQIDDDKPKLSEALYIRALLAEDDATRIADLSQAVKIDPGNLDALMQRAMDLMGEDKTDEAMQDFQRLLKGEKGSIDRHVVISQALRSRGLFPEAIKILDMAVAIEPENDDLFVLRGQSYLGTENDELALKDLDKALDLNRQNVDALSLRARVHVTREDFDKAPQDANELIQQMPDNANGLGLRSLIYRAQRKLDKAIEDVESLVEMEPDNLDFKFDLALLLNANEEPSRALPIFDQVLRLSRESAHSQILRSRGDAYLSLGKHEQAIDDYELALDLLAEADESGQADESNEKGELSEGDKELKSGILNNLSWVLATSPDEQTRDGKRSIKLATEAAELTDYKAAFILSTLASGYAEIGDFETARQWASKAVELAEDDEQRVGLQEELDSYKKNEPWRELENVEEKKKEKDPQATEEKSHQAENDGEGSKPMPSKSDEADDGSSSARDSQSPSADDSSDKPTPDQDDDGPPTLSVKSSPVFETNLACWVRSDQPLRLR